MSRVVVIGGGFGGTAAAARLAKQGHQVTLVERLDRLGGAVGFVERDGFRWDAGPTSTALPAVVRDLFRKSGRPLERELDLVQVQPMREHRFRDGAVLRMPSGSRAAQSDAVESTLGGGLGRQWVDYVHGFADTWDRLRRAYFEQAYSPEHVDRETRSLLRSRTSLHKVVTRTLKDDRLREVALHQSRLAGHEPRSVPAWMGLWAYVEQNFGVWTVPGGMGLLAVAMTKRLSERKVDVRLGTSALDLRLERGRVAAVETDHGCIDAEVVVCAIDPRGLPTLAAHARRTMPAMPPVVCHLGVTDAPMGLPHEVVLHGEPTLVLRTNGSAPDGCAAWTILGRGRLSEDVVVTLANRGIDVRDRVRVRVDRSPSAQVEELSGSAYGVLWQGRRSVDRKLAATPYHGLYAVGAHAAVEGTLPFVGLSAAVVADQIGPARRG